MIGVGDLVQQGIEDESTKNRGALGSLGRQRQVG
jgi:hypothetical protein